MLTRSRTLKVIQVGRLKIIVSLPPRDGQEFPLGRWLRRTRAAVHSVLRRLGRTTPRTGSSLSRPSGPTETQTFDAGAQAILHKVNQISWYHSIDLGHGVVTPGFVDHRDQVALYGLPESLTGKRCLDVATFDGFWAFEMERRGAAEVVALDVARWSDCDVPEMITPQSLSAQMDRPTGAGFRAAHEILGSRVQREICNVYDLGPDRFGTFDVVIVSDVLLHLRDPQRALERASSVCHGMIIVAEAFDPLIDGLGDLQLARYTAPSETWWLPNPNTLKAMVHVAGFEPVVEISRFVLNVSSVNPIHKVVLHGFVPERHSWTRFIEDHVVQGQGASNLSWGLREPTINRQEA